MDRSSGSVELAANQLPPDAIQSVTPSDPRYEEVIGHILSTAGEAAANVRGRVHRLLQHIEDQNLVLASVVAAISGGKCFSAAMMIETPGALGALFLPARGLQPRSALPILQRIGEAAQSRGIVLVQCLCRPDETESESMLSHAGFEFLAELVYLERPAQHGRITTQLPAQVEFETYRPSTRNTFMEVLAGTYQGSLDCPKLNGIRRTEDVLATHRATGIFDPDLWFVLRWNGRPSGVLLLSGVQGRSALEIVYMGVGHAARRNGLGHALLHHAIATCRQQGQTHLVLAVDAANEQAFHLYRRWDFHETHRRKAWIWGHHQAAKERRAEK
jgi:GNAT superfamily N-acetyltransferase